MKIKSLLKGRRAINQKDQKPNKELDLCRREIHSLILDSCNVYAAANVNNTKSEFACQRQINMCKPVIDTTFMPNMKHLLIIAMLE